METGGGSSLGPTSLLSKDGPNCFLEASGSKAKGAQSHLKWHPLDFYLPSFILSRTSTSSVKDCQKQGRGTLVTLSNEAQAADCPSGTGTIGVARIGCTAC